MTSVRPAQHSLEVDLKHLRPLSRLPSAQLLLQFCKPTKLLMNLLGLDTMWFTTLIMHALLLTHTALSSPLDPPSRDQLRSAAAPGPWAHGGPVLPVANPSSTAARGRSAKLSSRGPGARNGAAVSLTSRALPSPPSVLHLPRQTSSPTLPVPRGPPPDEALVPIPFPSLGSATVMGTGCANNKSHSNDNNTLPQPKPLSPRRPSHGAIPTVLAHAQADRADRPPFPLPTPAIAGCVTTTIGPLANPCPTDGVLTVHTSTRTHYRSVNCHGCTSVHVIAPMWGCPLMSAGGGGGGVATTTTPATPFTWTSTVCASLTEVGELTGTTTETASGLVTVTVTITGRPPEGSAAAGGGPRLVTTVVTSVVRETEVFTTTELVWPAGSTDALLPFSLSS